MPDFPEISIPLSTIVLGMLIYFVVGTIICLTALAHAEVVGWKWDLTAKWPPISDEQFVKLCKPGTNPKTAIRVRHIIAEQLGVDVERVHPDMNFVDDLGC